MLNDGPVRVGRYDVPYGEHLVVRKDDGGRYDIQIGLIADLLADQGRRDIITAMVADMLKDGLLRRLGAVRCPICGAVVENKQRHVLWHLDLANKPGEPTRVTMLIEKAGWGPIEGLSTCGSCGALSADGHVCAGVMNGNADGVA